MSKESDRRNVFKLSGNMALGGGMPGGNSGGNYKYTPQSDYNQEDITAAKNSLQLLKAKQQAKRAEEMIGSEVHSQFTQQRNAYPQYGGSTNSGSAGSYSNIKSSNSDWREQPPRDAYNQRTEQRRPPPSSQQQDYSYGNTGNSYGNNKYGKSSTEQQQRNKQPSDYGPPPPQRAPPQQQRNIYQPPQQQLPREKPISELKREQKRPELESQYDPSDFVECSAGCGRKFNPDSIEKHEKVCKKVFQSKRKEFNTMAQRIVEKDQVKLMNKGKAVEKKLEQQKKNEKMPKWKAESLAFRAVVAAKSNGPVDPKQQRELEQAMKEAAGYIKCQFCGRQFNDTAGKRHIPFCEEKSKKEMMKKKR